MASVYSYTINPKILSDLAETTTRDFDFFYLELNFHHYLRLSYPEEADVSFERFRDSFFYPRNLFLSQEHGLRTLFSIFSRTGGSDEFLETIVADVLSFAWEMDGDSVDLDQKACALVVDVLVLTPYDGREEINRALGESVQESRTAFKPASELAIKSLKRVRASERGTKMGNVLSSFCAFPIKKRRRSECLDSECGCMVCLEDFSGGDELVEIPCGHLYHSDCAVRWLETSHLCPLCRYPLEVGEEL